MALMITPNDPQVFLDRGRTYAAKGDFAQASADVSRAIEIDPTYAFAIAVRGALNEMQGRTGQALADFDAALAIDPTLAIARQGRARLAP
jgi:Tfp pilus assembly protein PilF